MARRCLTADSMADDWVRSGIPAEAIRCTVAGCDQPWDGTTPYTPPTCAEHRDLCNRIGLAIADDAMATARALRPSVAA